MQLELSLQAPERDLEGVALLCAWLYHAGDTWTTASNIGKALDLSERQIRHLAASSSGMIVSGPGCPGYKHIRHCDGEEVGTVTNRLRHQAKLMTDRAGDITREFHRSDR